MSLSVTVEPAAEIERRGFAALVRELGWSPAVRFLLRFESGVGNYAQERARILPSWSAEELVRRSDELRGEVGP